MQAILRLRSRDHQTPIGCGLAALSCQGETPTVGAGQRELPAVLTDAQQATTERNRSSGERRLQRFCTMPGAPILFYGIDEFGVTLADLIDIDAAGEEVKGELERFEGLVVPAEVFPPAQARPRGILDFSHPRLPVRLIVGQSQFEVVLVCRDLAGQRHGILHRHLGAGTDREVCGVHGVAQQHNVARVPRLCSAGMEVGPTGIVGHERLALDVFGKQPL